MKKIAIHNPQKISVQLCKKCQAPLFYGWLDYSDNTPSMWGYTCLKCNPLIIVKGDVS